jgi:hypothetical protein
MLYHLGHAQAILASAIFCTRFDLFDRDRNPLNFFLRIARIIDVSLHTQSQIMQFI